MFFVTSIRLGEISIFIVESRGERRSEEQIKERKEA